MGDGADKYITFDGDDVILGKGTRIVGADTYEGGSGFYHRFYARDCDTVNVSANAGSSLYNGGLEISIYGGATTSDFAYAAYQRVQTYTDTITGLAIDSYSEGDHREFHFVVADIRVANRQSNILTMVNHAGASTTNYDGMGIVYDYPTYGATWVGYIVYYDGASTVVGTVNLGDLGLSLNPYRVKIVYTGDPANGGGGEAHFYVDGTLQGSITGIVNISLGVTFFQQWLTVTSGTTSSFDDVRVGEVRVIITDPANIGS